MEVNHKNTKYTISFYIPGALISSTASLACTETMFKNHSNPIYLVLSFQETVNM